MYITASSFVRHPIRSIVARNTLRCRCKQQQKQYERKFWTLLQSTLLTETATATTTATTLKQLQLQPPCVLYKRTLFIQTLSTPNPESLKFVPGIQVLEDNDGTGNGFFVSKTDNPMEILRSPLAKKLLDLDGVKSVYLGSDFVTITKYAEKQWRMMRPELYDIIMEWADSGQPALTDEPTITDTTILDDDDEVVAMIKELIETKIRPAVQEDGGDIRYVGFDEETGIVTVKLAGSCVGCPSSSVTLKQGVENMLKHYVREVTSVVSLEEEATADENETSTTETETSSETPDGTTPSTVVVEKSKQQKTYEERLAAAGIPFSD